MSSSQNISSKMEEGLFWIPRSLAIIGTLVMLVFSYESLWDSFNLSGWELILYAHIIPALIIAILLFISWWYEIIGGFGFIILSLASLIVLEAGNSGIAMVFIAVPLLLTGVLFLMHGSEYDLSIYKHTLRT